MKINKFAAAFLLIPGLGFCAPAPNAWGEAPMNGTYRYTDEDGDVGTWVIGTSCTPGCVAHVTTSPGRGFDAALVDGRYTNTRTVPEGVSCTWYGWEGIGTQISTHAVTVTQWWDPATLTGEVNFLGTDAPCGVHEDPRDRFTLTKLG